MKHYSQMTDTELGEEVLSQAKALNEEDVGGAVRRLLDSMELDELETVRAEVDRTARVVMALASAESARHLQQGWTSLDNEVLMLERLRLRQATLEAQRQPAKGGE